MSEEEPLSKRLRRENEEAWKSRLERERKENLWSEGGEEARFADWTVTVEAEDGSLMRQFSVHRVMIAPKSKYFDAMFDGNFAEEKGRITRLKFHKIVVQHFDLFLDFCYRSGVSSKVSIMYMCPKEVCSLLVLGDYLGAEELGNIARAEFHRVFQNVDGVLPEFYEVCKKLDFPKLYTMIVKKAALKPEIITSNEEFLNTVEIDFIIEILEQRTKMPKRLLTNERFVHGVGMVTRFCQVRQSSLEYDAFLRLTNEKYFPILTYRPHFVEEVDPNLIEHVMMLLAIQASLMQKCGCSRENDALTTLENRCVQILHNHAYSGEDVPGSDRYAIKHKTAVEFPQLAKTLSQCDILRKVFEEEDTSGELDANFFSVKLRKNEEGKYGFTLTTFEGRLVVGKNVFAPCTLGIGDIIMAANGHVFEKTERPPSEMIPMWHKAVSPAAESVDVILMSLDHFKKRFEVAFRRAGMDDAG